MIPINKFTTKSQEALQMAHRFVYENKHDVMHPIHLLLILTEQDEGVVVSILNKLGININDLKTRLREEIDKLPKISGEIDINRIAVSSEFNKSLLNLSIPRIWPR